MTQMKDARKALTRVIEAYALDNAVSFPQAAREVTSQPEYVDLAMTAFGNWWKKGPITYAMILGLRNRRKQGLVRYFDLLREDQIQLVQPYLPVHRRLGSLRTAA